MSAKKGGAAWSDQDTEQIIGTLLRVGVLMSALTVGVGGGIYLWQFGQLQPHHSIFTGEPASLRSPAAILSGLTSGNGRAIIQTGVLLLIATPIARVIFSVWAFHKEKDRLYVSITLIVLATLTFSLIWG
jgi:uncharacterized membrane protein